MRLKSSLFVSLSLIALAACTSVDGSLSSASLDAPSTLDMRLRVIEELKVAKRNADIPALLALYHPEVVLEQPSMGFRSEGLVELKPGLESFARHFPDYNRKLLGFAETGNTIVSWGPTTVTLTGPFGDAMPNGETSSLMTFVVFEFEGEQIIYEGHFWDLASLARQSGLSAETIFEAAQPGSKS